MNKNIFTILIATLVFFSFTGCRDIDEDILTTPEEGVVINGLRWATRNVAAPGSFVANPQDEGRVFQWNRRQGWHSTSGTAAWNSSGAEGTLWDSPNDPCPTGWRVPTRAELQSLGLGTWTENWNGTGVAGQVFGTAPSQLFLPAAGWRDAADGRRFNAGTVGRYWSRTASTAVNASFFGFNRLGSAHDDDNRAMGFGVRCVTAN